LRPRVGIALAGGGPEGAIYEIGALRALDEAIDGLDLNDLDLYVGVSAGAFIGACLANGLTPAQMCRAIVKHEPGEHPFVPSTFFTPAVGELWRRGSRLPAVLVEALWDFARSPGDPSLLEALTRTARALPVGIFDNEPIRRYLETIYNLPGRSDDFRRLRRRLVVVAADLESGRSVRFGGPGFAHVPISTAVQASTALPGIYPPVEIDGRFYVDGVLRKTLHASVALAAGVELLLCLNPLVPLDTGRSAGRKRRRLLDHGLPSVLSQTFRTLIHSRFELSFAEYARRYPGADVLLFEAGRRDETMFFTNIFSFSARRTIAEHAYRVTRRELWRRRREIDPVLRRHGASLRLDVLADRRRNLWRGVGVAGRLEATLDRLERHVESVARS
jgi:predicted acylesterase/phospholipase RssA